MGKEGVSERTCGIASGEMITVGGVEVKLKIFGPARADIYVDLKYIVIDSGADRHGNKTVKQFELKQVKTEKSTRSPQKIKGIWDFNLTSNYSSNEHKGGPTYT